MWDFFSEKQKTQKFLGFLFFIICEMQLAIVWVFYTRITRLPRRKLLAMTVKYSRYSRIGVGAPLVGALFLKKFSRHGEQNKVNRSNLRNFWKKKRTTFVVLFLH